jgi:hypothetical protein
MTAARRKLGITALVFVTINPALQISARADSADDALARVRALEKEIAAIKQENDALRRVNKLREQNAVLVKQTANTSARAAPAQLLKRQEPREAFAADHPIYAKVVVPVERGQFRVWGEGGAIWSGGFRSTILYAFDGVVRIGGHYGAGIFSTLAKSRLGSRDRV